MAVSGTAEQAEAAGKGLKAGSLGLLGSVVMGIASTAPRTAWPRASATS
jgi:hypothetical protein